MKELLVVLQKEHDALNSLLDLLDKQYQLIMKKELFPLEAIVDEIKIANKNVAEQEVLRRKVTDGKSMKQIIQDSKNEALEIQFRELNKTISAIVLQKETNEMLLKKEITFNNRVLNIINPNRDIKTYNSYGNLRR